MKTLLKMSALVTILTCMSTINAAAEVDTVKENFTMAAIGNLEDNGIQSSNFYTECFVSNFGNESVCNSKTSNYVGDVSLRISISQNCTNVDEVYTCTIRPEVVE